MGRTRTSLFTVEQIRPVFVVPLDAKIAFAAVEDIADAAGIAFAIDTDLILEICGPVTHLKGQHLILAAFAKFVRHREGVRGLLVIVEHVVTADRAYFVRITDAKSPARDIQFVDTLIAEISVSVVPEPVPVVVETVFGESMLRS